MQEKLVTILTMKYNKLYTSIFFLLLIENVFAQSISSDCLALIKDNQCQEAVLACSLLAEEGDPKSQTLLSLLLSGTSDGDFRRNYKQSFNWISQAADQGYTKAELALAEMYMNGEVIPMNAKKAKVWYEKAAAKENMDGINGLARLYRYGTGVRKDYEKAFSLYEKAALKNHIRSQVGLGLSYRDAKGAKKNLVKAYAWLTIASENISDSSFKKIQKDYEDERDSIDKSKPQCKYIAKIDEFSERMAVGYAKRALFDLKKRMSLNQIKKAKNLAIEIKKERVRARSLD